MVNMLGESLDLLDGENNRLLYLPAITLGYLFTLTGSSYDFALAVVLVAGGRALSDIVEKLQSVEEDGDLENLPADAWEYADEISLVFIAYLAVIFLLYVFGLVWGWYLLYKLFDHSDLVIVGISIGYCGVILIVLANIIRGEF